VLHDTGYYARQSWAEVLGLPVSLVLELHRRLVDQKKAEADERKKARQKQKR